MKKLLFWGGIILSASLATSCYQEEADFTVNDSQQPRITQEVASDIQEDANELNTALLAEMPIGTRASDGGRIYPDYYGGSFIERNGDLTILVKGDSANAVRRIRSIKDSDLLRFRSCEYSYQELSDIMTHLNETILSSDIELRKNLSGYGLNDGENVIDVHLVVCTPERIAEFKSFYDHPALRFSQMGKVELDSGEDYSFPGDKLCLSQTNPNFDYGSYAFRAREKDGQKREGMVTAGHVINAGRVCYDSYGLIFGQCTQSIYGGGKVDAAFVYCTSNYHALTNYVANNSSNVLSTETSLPGAGTYVNKWGATTGHTGGYILDTNYTVSDKTGTKILYDMTAANYETKSGDSGGVVYTYVSNKNMRYTVGVNQGHSPDGTKSFYSKADNVLDILNLERY